MHALPRAQSVQRAVDLLVHGYVLREQLVELVLQLAAGGGGGGAKKRSLEEPRGGERARMSEEACIGLGRLLVPHVSHVLIVHVRRELSAAF